MTETTTVEKAAGYLAEGRLTVTSSDGQEVTAVCVGRSGRYQLGFNLDRRWWCTCPARRQCSHLTALQLVTVRAVADPRPEGDTDGLECRG